MKASYLPRLQSVVCFNNFLAVVCSACLAYSVCKIIFTAFGAFCHAGKIKFPDAGTSFVSSCLRDFFLRYCHVDDLLYYFSVICCLAYHLSRSVLRIASLGSPSDFLQPQSPSFKFFPHRGQSPRQSSRQRIFDGISRSISSKSGAVISSFVSSGKM